jgi:Ca2+-binding RTX toxin-like protein
VLDGSGGNDTLDGGAGNDTLTGGTDADQFQFSGVAANSTTNRDTITDFMTGTDKLVFSRGVYGGFATNATTITSTQLIQSATFTGAFTSTIQRFGYNSSSGILYFDRDGSGSLATQQVALLGTSTHPTALATMDFILMS